MDSRECGLVAAYLLGLMEQAMILLQSSERFDDVAEMDESTGVWRLMSRSSAGEDLPAPAEISGSFAVLSGVFCALFRSRGELFVRIGETTVKLSNAIQLIVDGPPERRCLSLVVDGHEHARVEYARASKPVENDPTPFIDDEDFDFGLFLANVAADPDRQAVLKSRA